MKLSQTLVRRPLRITSSAPLRRRTSVLRPDASGRIFGFGNHGVRFFNCACSSSGPAVSSAADASSPVMASSSGYDSGISRKKPGKLEAMEEDIEKVRV